MIRLRYSSRLPVVLAVLLAWPGPVAAQFTEPPAPAAYALQDVTVVRSDGTRIEGVTMVIRGQMIEALGADIELPADAKLLEGDSLFVYPGLVDGQGGAEYEFPEIKLDRSAIGSWDPPRSAQSYMPHRRVVDYLTATGVGLAGRRKKGVVAAAVHPTGRLMPGRGTLLIFRTNAETPGELVAQPVLGPVMSFRGAQGVYPASLFGVIAFYRQKFEDAKHLSAQMQAFERDPSGLTAPQWDPDLDVVRQTMGGQIPVFFEVDLARDIRRVLMLAREYNFRPIIVGGDEAWHVADELKRQSVPVLVSLDFPKPERWKPDKEEKKKEPEEAPPGAESANNDVASQEEGEELDAGALREKERLENIYSNAGRLSAAGVSFALTSGGGKADMLEGARKAIKYGLPENAALSAVTVTPASLFGFDYVTELSPGQAANLVVTDGPLFDEETEIRYTFVEGALEEGDRKKAGGDEPPAVDMTGTWDMTIESEGGTILSKATIEQEGGNFEGTSVSEFGESKIVDGTVSGNTINFTVIVDLGDETISVTFSGTVEGDTASGTAESPDETLTWTGKRASGPDEEGQR